MQNRVAKYNIGFGVENRQYYFRDAQGNVMATYKLWKHTSGGVTYLDSVKLMEQHIYGSARVGMVAPELKLYPVVPANPHALDSCHYRIFEGWKRYEITNHLGNVLAVITDRKRGQGSSGDIEWFAADVLAAQQYYPFGMLMPGDTSANVRRQYSLNGADYRYGFNGKEGDDEVKGDDNQQDYGMRIYDPRAARFLSVDPIAREYPELTPYQFASNTPISGVDLDGLEYYYSADGGYLGWTGKSTEIRIITNNEVVSMAKESLKYPHWRHDWLRESHHSQQAYTNPDQVALDWAYEYNPKTHVTQLKYNEMPYGVRQLEYGAMIGSLETKDGKGNSITLYTIGTTILEELGDAGSVAILESKTLSGWKRTHGVHTHTGKGNIDTDEQFSDRHNNLGYNSDIELAHQNNLKLYLATPRGKLNLYDPTTHTASEIASGVPRSEGVDVVENGTFKDTKGRERTLYKIVYKKLKAPLLEKAEPKK